MFFCLYNGIGTALQPLASANFGAKQQDRVSKTLALSLKLSCLLGFVFLFLSELFPGAILNIYMDVNEDVMSIGPDIMRIYLSSILFTGISIVSTFYFQSVLRRGYSLCISMARGLVFPILFVIILTLIFGKDAIWWSTPAAELATFILSVLLLISERRSGTKPTRI
jgi:Na+-driven multidrug efflux pump